MSRKTTLLSVKPCTQRFFPTRAQTPYASTTGDHLPHHTLIQKMKLLGLKANEGGVCYGISCMAIQDALSDGIRVFDDRLKQVNQLALGQHSPVLYTAKNFLLHTDMAFQPDAYITHFKLDIPTQKPLQKPELVFPAIETKKVKEAGGIIKTGQYASAYDLTDLAQYFHALQNAIEQHPHNNAFLLCSEQHAITAGYDIKKSAWFLVDANFLPTKYYNNNTKMALATNKALHRSGRKMFLSSEIFCTHDNETTSKNMLSTLETLPAWLAVHSEHAIKKHSSKERYGILSLASRSGDHQTVERLLKDQPYPTEPDSQIYTLLFLAALFNNVDTLETLLRHGARTDITKQKVTPLLAATDHGNISVVNKLCEHGVKLNRLLKNNQTVLSCATEEGHTTIVKALLAHGAKPNIRGERHSPLYFAWAKQYIDIVNMLLAQGAKLQPKEEKALAKHWEAYVASDNSNELRP